MTSSTRETQGQEVLEEQTMSLPSQSSSSSSCSSFQYPQNPNLSPCLVATLKGNSSYVSGLVLDSDSLYVASSDGHIRLWPLDMAMDVQRAEQSTCTVAAVTSSPIKSIIATSNGGPLVSSHQDGKIRVWHAAPRRDGSARGGHLALLRLRAVAVLPTAADCLRAFLFPSNSNYVEVRRRHRRRRTWVHHVDAVTALAVSPDGAEMYSVSWDRSLKAWRLPSLRCAESVAPAHDDAINAVAVAADGHVYTGSADRTVRAWRRQPPQPGRQGGKLALVATMERHKAAVNALALGADGRVLYSGACDKTLVVWERAGAGEAVAATAATATLRGHTGAVLCLAAAGQVVCSGSADRTVRVWRREATAAAASYTCLAVLEGHAAAVKSLALLVNRSGGDHGGSCDERCCCGCRCAAFVCSGSLDCDVKIWSVDVSCLGLAV